MGYTICPEYVRLCTCGVTITVRTYIAWTCGAGHDHERVRVVRAHDDSSVAVHIGHLMQRRSEA